MSHSDKFDKLNRMREEGLTGGSPERADSQHGRGRLHSPPALPLGVSACIGCGGRVYSLEHDGYCEACNPITVPDDRKHWAWTVDIFSEVLREDIKNPHVPLLNIKATAMLVAHQAFKLHPWLKQNAFDAFLSKAVSDCVNAR